MVEKLTASLLSSLGIFFLYNCPGNTLHNSKGTTTGDEDFPARLTPTIRGYRSLILIDA